MVLSFCLYAALTGVVVLPLLATAPAQLVCTLFVCLNLFFVLTSVGFELLPLLLLMVMVGAVLVLFIFAIALIETAPIKTASSNAARVMARGLTRWVFLLACVKAIFFAAALCPPLYSGVGLLLPTEELCTITFLYSPDVYLSLVVFLGFVLTVVLCAGTFTYLQKRDKGDGGN